MVPGKDPDHPDLVPCEPEEAAHTECALESSRSGWVINLEATS